MDFSTIKGHIREYVIDVPAETEALLDDWVNEALLDAERRHNFQHMYATESYTTTEDTRKLGDVPDNYKEPRGLPWKLFDDGQTVEFDWAASESDMIRQYGNDNDLDDGEPEFLLEVYNQTSGKREFHLYPLPDDNSDYSDGDYRIEVPVWLYSPALADEGDTNWFTNQFPFYLIYKATYFGLLFNRDESRASAFNQLAEQMYRNAKSLDKRSKIPPRFTMPARRGVHAPSKRPRGRIRHRDWEPN